MGLFRYRENTSVVDNLLRSVVITIQHRTSVVEEMCSIPIKVLYFCPVKKTAFSGLKGQTTSQIFRQVETPIRKRGEIYRYVPLDKYRF